MVVAMPGRRAPVPSTAIPPPCGGQACAQARPDGGFPLWFLFPPQFILLILMFYFVVVLWFVKGDGMKAPGPLCLEVALQKAAVVFFITHMPQNLTRKDNS